MAPEYQTKINQGNQTMSRIHFNNLKHFQKTGPFDPLHQINGRNEIWGITELRVSNFNSPL